MRIRTTSRQAAGTRPWARRRAILAGGLVLGLGATMTMAAWTDEVHVFGEFGTGDHLVQFQGNTTSPLDPNAWHDYHGTQNPARGELAFGVDAGDLAPGDVIYAPISLRTVTDSDAFDVTLRSEEPDTTGWDATDQVLYENLVYRVAQVAGPTSCDASGFAAAITGGGAVSGLGSDAPIDTDSGTNAINLPAGSGGNPGQTKTYCFEVKLDPDATLDELTALQTGAATANWVFEGTAVEAS